MRPRFVVTTLVVPASTNDWSRHYQTGQTLALAYEELNGCWCCRVRATPPKEAYELHFLGNGKRTGVLFVGGIL